jgi:signal transduction histidine kinase
MQRVEDLSRRARVLVDVRKDVLDGMPAPPSSSLVVDECRRLAELLGLDAVGVVHGLGWDGRAEWWVAPDAAPLPGDVADILSRLVEGWIVHPVSDDTFVLGRTAPETSPRAAAILGSMGDSLVGLLWTVNGSRGGSSAAPSPEYDADVDAKAQRSSEPATRRVFLEAELAGLCHTMGFEGASLFAPRHGRGWQLEARTGPERAWQSLLDPGATGPLGSGLVFADARAMPGIGPRLASLGCGALAILPVPGGARVILDAETVRRGIPSVDRAREHLSRLGALTGDIRSSELRLVERVTAVVRETLEDPGADLPELIESVRAALGADEVFHLAERAGGVVVVSSPPNGKTSEAPADLRAGLQALPSRGPIEDAAAVQLGVLVGASSTMICAGVARHLPREALVAGWGTGPGLSPEAMKVVAEVIGTARSVVESRRHAVDVLMTRERNRWAYEIHDGLTQAVTTAVLELEALGRQIEQDPGAALHTLAATRAEIRKSLSEVRGLLYELHGDEKASAPLDEPLTKYVNDVVRRWRLPARVAVSGDLQHVPKHLLGVAYVVIREALANAAKHAAARAVTVSVNAAPQHLTVEVGDTGRGFDPQAGPTGADRRNFGLEMVRKRVAEAGGTVTVHSAPGQGTRVVAQLPVGEGKR